MKTTLLFVLILHCFSFMNAQTFIEVSPSPFEALAFVAIDISDVDGDGLNDVLMSGARENSKMLVTILYINEGNGEFTSKEIMDGVHSGSCDFSDVNLDGFKDFFITGESSNEEKISKLYLNDGQGNFTEKDVSVTPISKSSVLFFDADNDGIEDLLISGEYGGQSWPSSTARLYINDGQGNFTKLEDTPFIGAQKGASDFSDVDNDGDFDVLISGTYYADSNCSIRFYYNDENGVFTQDQNDPFNAILKGDIKFVDINKDGMEEVLIAGLNKDLQPILDLFINDNGAFTKSDEFNNLAFSYSSIEVLDYNNNDLVDIVISGSDQNNDIATRVFEISENGKYEELFGHGFVDVFYSTLKTGDLNNDGIDDLIVSGFDDKTNQITELYLSNADVSSVPKTISQSNVFAYPNPSFGSGISLKYTGKEFGKVQIKLYNTEGVVIHEQLDILNGSDANILLRNKELTSGLYIIELITERNRNISKIVVN